MFVVSEGLQSASMATEPVVRLVQDRSLDRYLMNRSSRLLLCHEFSLACKRDQVLLRCSGVNVGVNIGIHYNSAKLNVHGTPEVLWRLLPFLKQYNKPRATTTLHTNTIKHPIISTQPRTCARKQKEPSGANRLGEKFKVIIATKQGGVLNSRSVELATPWILFMLVLFSIEWCVMRATEPNSDMSRILLGSCSEVDVEKQR